jgi:hypothetical protein
MTEHEEIYQPPELVEVGDYTELTEGFYGFYWDGFGGYWGH